MISCLGCSYTHPKNNGPVGYWLVPDDMRRAPSLFENAKTRLSQSSLSVKSVESHLCAGQTYFTLPKVVFGTAESFVTGRTLLLILAHANRRNYRHELLHMTIYSTKKKRHLYLGSTNMMLMHQQPALDIYPCPSAEKLFHQ